MKKIVKIIIVVITLFLITSCFSNSTKVTNNSINNKVIHVEDYTISDLQGAIMTASEKVEDAVVAITESSMTSQSLGSAVIIKRTAYNGNRLVEENNSEITHYEYIALTNEHVIDGLISLKYRVYLSDKVTNVNYSSTEVSVVEKDANLDLAIIKFTSTMYKEVVKVKNSNSLKKGQIVIAVGTPMSLEYYNSVTYGIISHPYRTVNIDGHNGTYIQHDASINPGNSGGGLFDLEGNLIGINTWKLADSEEVVVGIGFAIPSNIIYTKYAKYIQNYQ